MPRRDTDAKDSQKFLPTHKLFCANSLKCNRYTIMKVFLVVKNMVKKPRDVRIKRAFNKPNAFFAPIKRLYNRVWEIIV